MLGQLGLAGLHAAGKRGAAGLLNAVDRSLERILVGGERGGGQHLHGIVEQHDRHNILRRQGIDHPLGGVLHGGQLWALHRAGAVEHQAKVQRHGLGSRSGQSICVVNNLTHYRFLSYLFLVRALHL